MVHDERCLEVAAGIIRLVAERDMAQKCADQANEDYGLMVARNEKQMSARRREMDALFESAEKVEEAMLLLVTEAEPFANSSGSLLAAINRCRATRLRLGPPYTQPEEE